MSGNIENRLKRVERAATAKGGNEPITAILHHVIEPTDEGNKLVSVIRLEVGGDLVTFDRLEGETDDELIARGAGEARFALPDNGRGDRLS